MKKIVFILDNCTKILAEMTDEERINRSDNHTNAIDVFAKWFNEEID